MARIYGQSIFVGDILPTHQCGDVIVVRYQDSRNVTVMFEDGHTKVVTVRNLVNRQVKNEYQRSMCGVGYLGVGKFSAYTNGHVASQEYRAWKGMIQRCYDEEFLKGNLTYKGCITCNEWHNFQNFANWYVAQQGYSEGWQLDKDLTILGNKMYSPETCSLVPREVNNLLVNSKAKRGEFPIGVYLCKRRNDFVARISRGSVVECLGRYPQQHLAFAAYKVAKEAYIKVVADKHKGILSESIYSNLMSYTVEITD